MTVMSKFKLGDKITIEVNRKRGAKTAQPAEGERRYGPEPRIPERDDPLAPANIVFHDSSMKWVDFGDDSHLEGNDNPLPPGVMSYVPILPSISADPIIPESIAALAASYRLTFFNRDPVKLPPFVGTEYRKVSRALPIAREAADALELEVKIGPRTFPFKGPNLIAAAAAQKRLESALAASDPDAALIAALEKEVHESSFATGQSICREDVVPQLWYTHAERDQRAVFRDYGVFKPKIQPGSYKIALKDNFYFEPFDLSDTENYKITKRLADQDTAATFESEEVPAPKIRVGVNKQRRVYLVPKLWRYELHFVRRMIDEWDDLQGLQGSLTQSAWGESRTVTGYVSAFSSPLILTGWETPANFTSALFTNHPAYLHAFGDAAWKRDDTSDEAFLRFMMQLSLNLAGVGVEIVLQEPNTDQPPDAHPPHHYLYARTYLNAQSDASIAITQEGAPEGMLVAGIEIEDDDDQRYLIWRKTQRTVEADTISYDDPGYNSVIGGFILPPACIRKLHSAAWTGVHPPNRWAWQTGGLCDSDGLWTYFMQPRWCEV